jgi:hypothetical protein
LQKEDTPEALKGRLTYFHIYIYKEGNTAHMGIYFDYEGVWSTKSYYELDMRDRRAHVLYSYKKLLYLVTEEQGRSEKQAQTSNDYKLFISDIHFLYLLVTKQYHLAVADWRVREHRM